MDIWGGKSAVNEIVFGQQHCALLFKSAGPVSGTRQREGAGGNVLLRRTQYRIADSPPDSLEIAKSFIIGKTVNCRTVLGGRGIRDHGDTVDGRKVTTADRLLIEHMLKIEDCTTADSLRGGIEGNCARFYFSALDELILKQKEDFYLNERNRRPPPVTI